MTLVVGYVGYQLNSVGYGVGLESLAVAGLSAMSAMPRTYVRDSKSKAMCPHTTRAYRAYPTYPTYPTRQAQRASCLSAMRKRLPDIADSRARVRAFPFSASFRRNGKGGLA